jgi:3-dehydroquinate dehydratase/shikimate dehydrogenase
VSTLICCPIHVDGLADREAALEAARRAAAKGARLVEWRCDLLAEESIEPAAALIRALVAECPVPSIVTIRPTWEGGLYGGGESERISLFEAVGIGEGAPRYLDLELDAYRTSRNRRQKILLAVDHDGQVREAASRLILSTHDFEGRPSDLLQRVAAMSGESACAVMKVAWKARSIRDNLEAFDLLAERRKPSVVLCMGEFGLASRVLAPKFGGLFTFASLERGRESAPGQPTIDELRTLYRFDAIGPGTKVYGVVGWPVGHSRSPAFHNAAFAAAGHDGVYLPLPVPPEWEHFKATIGALLDHPRLDLAGASVTIPHKEHLVRFVRERGGPVGALAEALGAANTLIVDAGHAACANTDAPALAESLAAAFGRADGRLEGLRVAILGAGGVARAAAGGVALAGGHAIVFNRSAERAEALVADLARGLGAFDAARLDAAEAMPIAARQGTIAVGRLDAIACNCFHAFVNCTPLGMEGGPDADANPIAALAEGGGADADQIRYDGLVVLDTVYAPERTPLIREAAERGATTVSGLAMFRAQAERQFRRWTGQVLPQRG